MSFILKNFLFSLSLSSSRKNKIAYALSYVLVVSSHNNSSNYELHDFNTSIKEEPVYIILGGVCHQGINSKLELSGIHSLFVAFMVLVDSTVVL